MSKCVNPQGRWSMSLPVIKALAIAVLGLSYLFSGNSAMAYPTFTCAYEKDHNPPLDAEADQWFKQARRLEKAMGPWPEVERLYLKAIEKDHWKAMHNLASLYRTGFPGEPGIEKDLNKMLDLYERMVELKVPLGYYNWAVAAERGKGMLKSDRMASSYMFQAAQLGSPLAQARLGNFFAFELPRDKQDEALAETYFKCAGAQDSPEAVMETAAFYELSKENKPRALFYYQRAASLGSSMGFDALVGAFSEKLDPTNNFGYKPDPVLHKLYSDLWRQLDENPNLRFPDLMKDHPLPPHPTQGFDAEHPDRRPEL
jgi:hypothetical protein